MSNRVLVWLTLLLLLTALGSYVYYRRTMASVPVDPWALVPDDAVLVTMTRDHPTLVRHLKETQVWDNLTAVRYFQQVEENLVLVDSLVGGRDVLLSFLGRKRVLTSVHVTGPQQFGLLFQVPIASVREYRQVRGLLESLGRAPDFQVSTRDYEGQVLTDVRRREPPEGEESAGLTLLNYRNHLVFSSNPKLVEAVVRRLARPEAPTVAAEFQSIDYFRLRDVDATLLLNQRRLPQLLGVLFRTELTPEIAAVASLARNELTEMRLAGNKVVFRGFANPEVARGSLHQRLVGQPAQRLRMAEVLPLRAALVVHLGLGSVAALRGPRPPAAPDSLAPAAPPLLDSLRAQLSREVALCYLSTNSARLRPGKLALVYTASPARVTALLGQLRRAVGASPSFGKVGGYQLYQTGVAELPQQLLGDLFTGFGPRPVVAQVGSYVVFGDDEAALRQYLADVSAGDTWSRSPTQVAFLQDTPPLARLRVLLDTRNCWNLLLRGLQEQRRAGLLRNETLFKRFPQVALNWVPADNEQEAGAQYFTQFILRHPAEGPAEARPQNADGTGAVLDFKTPLRSSPEAVMVAGAKLPGVLVQDTAHVLHYVTPENVVAWSDSLPGPLVGPTVRLPGATGFLLATPRQLFQYNNRGQLQPNFPLNLPDTVRATALSVSPATREGGPRRLLVAGGGSNLFLYDTQGHIYAGWQPKQLEFRLAAPPQYLTVDGRDVVLVLLENGYVYAFDQAGGAYPGFPLSVGARLASAAFVETGPTLRRTRLTVVNQHGERVSFNLSGDVVARRRVATWSRDSRFRLVADQKQDSYVVSREEGGRLTLFNPEGKALLSQSFLTTAPRSVQYFNFGPDRQVYVLTETGPGKAYLYDARFRLVGGKPFDSTTPRVDLTYNPATSTFHLFRVNGNELRRTDVLVK
ncbi:hypothetical protein [Hymenobacter psychrophilus]|uniref:Outer membrane protein assembly factor BamB, contains PQQ-like beta-propeller repeat n=1 Tax=Hymenobacter psychrophilus TaxID=651662 RepID=A0A1H3C094_9BACT|nr:hypothetical protein [Hymenobacter psychrophilus]SDX47577.1 hypothetical protein SAMN04488069_101494 [Hymenobacter psychrophilus]